MISDSRLNMVDMIYIVSIHLSMAMRQEPMKIGGAYHVCLAFLSSLDFREYPHKLWPDISGWWFEPL